MKKKDNFKHKKINSAFVNAGPYLSIGYFFIGAFALFGFIGYKVDQAYGLKPLFVLIGLFLALALSFYNMYKVISNIEKKKNDVQ